MSPSTHHFQRLVGTWLKMAFGPDERFKRGERAARYLEESLELAQAIGLSEGKALALVKQVYAKPPGDVRQEIGGAYTTLLAVGFACEENVGEAGYQELLRAFERIEEIRERNKLKVRGED